MKTIAVMPVLGRHPLLKHTISRLLNKNKCDLVICAGNREDRQVCEKAGAIFTTQDNRFLGRKWNTLFAIAKTHSPDAVLFVGSSDWLTDDWIPTMSKHLTSKVHMVGKAGCYMLDIKTQGNASYTTYRKQYPTPEYRLLYWPGYKWGSPKDHKHNRDHESIGIGRLISREGLESIRWRPFDNNLNFSLDFSMYKKFFKRSKIVYNGSIHSMGISTDRWINKHTFESHWNNTNPSKRILDPHKFCKKWFDEYDKIF